jgi:hypothetical protein
MHVFLPGVPLGLLCVSLLACGPIVDRAPFSYRPDTMSSGDLLGPFDGMVVDAETDRPVTGAVVSASWAFERGVGLTGPAGASEVVTETGADGRYRLPAIDALPSGASMRVRRFTMVVYQPGYVGWRSDRLFPERTRRRDFSQRGNRVRLAKWREGLSHHEHLVFLGGGPAIRAVTQPEVKSALMELDGQRVPGPAVPGQPPGAAAGPGRGLPQLDAAPLLSVEEIRGVTGYAGEFDVSKLTDLPTTEFYDSRHFKARGQPEAFDVALRVWRLGTAGAETQYRKLLGELPGATPADEVGDASLRARAADVQGLAFMLRERGLVLALSCGVRQCPEMTMLVRLAKLVESHLGELSVALPPVEGTAPAPTAPTPTAPTPGTPAAPVEALPATPPAAPAPGGVPPGGTVP